MVTHSTQEGAMRRTLIPALFVIPIALAAFLVAAACDPPRGTEDPRRAAKPDDGQGDERPFVPPKGTGEPDLAEGKNLIRSGSWEAALKWFEEAVKRNPEDSRPAFYKAVCLYNLKRHKDALEAYIAASRLKPAFFELWLNLGTVLIVTEQPKKAIGALEQALRFRADSADAWLNLGVAHEENKDLPAAARALEKAVTHGPSRADTHLALADVLRKLGRYEAAAKAYAEADQKRPDDLYTLLGMAVSLARSNQGAEAEKTLGRARTLQPQALQVHMAAGLVFTLLGRHAEAERAYATALAIKPDQPQILLLRGRALLELKKLADAVKTLERSRTLGGARLPAASFWLGEAHRRAGRCALAKPLYSAYLEAVPEGPEADQAKAHLRRCQK